jgi:predicted dienelactone hydrolase
MTITPPKQPSLGHRIWRLFAGVAMFGLLAIAILLAALWLDHRTAVTLPAPTGPFAVGRVTYDWTDDASEDKLAPIPGTKRELLVWIWYPAAPRQSTSTHDYLPAPPRTAVQRDSSTIIKFLTRDLSKIRSHSNPDAELSPQQQSYPIVIMRAGASSEVWNYSTLAEDLASHGYIVVGPDAPYRTFVVVFSDGRVIRRTPENNPELCEGQPPTQQARCVDRALTAWLSDVSFVFDRLQQLNAPDPSGKFKGRLDLSRVGLFGHSFGGATAAQFCHDDSRCKAAVDVDGRPFGSVIQSGLRQPFMFLMSDHGRESDPEGRQIMADIQSIYDRLPPDRRVYVTIRGANHFLFSDDGALLKSHIVMRILRAFGVVGIDGRRQLAVTAYCLRNFFDAYLKGTTTTPPNLSSPLYPELEVAK